MNALVKDGVELDRVYAYHYCSPTRSSFLTGRLPLHVNQINLGGGTANMSGTIYREGVDVRMTMLPKKLAASGYVSYQIGKW
jgi:arylsulfatase I/J